MRKKNLLIDEYPLLVLPSLAKAIGLNEAIALQQLHYWLQNPKGGVELDGERWVYNTYEDWQKDNFPFWSIPTIQRVFASLEKKGLVISKQQAAYDRKKYYRIHHINLIRWNISDWDDASYQNDMIDDSNLIPSLTETTTETTTERTTERAATAPNIFVAYQNNIGMITSMIADSLKDAEGEYGPEWIIDAIQIAVENNKRNWRYCLAILDRWKRQGKDEGRKPSKKSNNQDDGDRAKYVEGEYAEFVEH